MLTNLTIWKRLHWAEYIAEVIGTTLVVFVGLSTAVFNFAEGLPMEQLIPDRGLRLLMTGVVFAGSGSLVAISPLGKLSGAHINPAVSLAFWIQGKMSEIDFLGYIIAQFCGGIVGAFLLVTVWGKYAASVNNGMTLPGTDYSLLFVFSAEIYMTFLLVLSISIFLSSSRLMQWTPLMTWLLMATMVWLGSPISGTSVNPARSFGPALVTWFWQDQWIYYIGPILGSLMAVMAFRLLSMGKRSVLTGKLFHVPHYRCIFQNIKAPHLQDGRIYSKI
ncbi:MIP/aquaporin family protein [Merismopedia glauca]|uniref:Aquaporin family protein n=1 Tax=Merismopedia glauca CCAP 1448/3 TaxID=1296344 RepID=A0A2T1C4R8_9CYAN|nr:aquaporin [Merismopedia glauca]PSB03137.1 aquaporin family protein [Merismopedia glauca CCAP 1448/3]